MEQKKASHKDFRKQTPQYFFIGLVIALSTTLLAFEYRTPATVSSVLIFEDSGFDLLEDQILFSLPKPEIPAPAPKQKRVIIAPIPLEPSPILKVVPLSAVAQVIVSEFRGSEIEIPEIEDIPKNFAEVMPQFRNGNGALTAYLAREMKYPPFAQDINIEAKLYVQFIVNKDGSISDVKVLNPQGYGFDKEAIRVIKSMPDWQPGKQAGNKVRVYCVIPIIFALM